MREILFRGYSTALRKWFEGDLVHSPDINHPVICNNDSFVNVSKKTIGQYTGLLDKDGKKIFEGDIVKHYHDKKFPESYSKGYVFWDEEYLRWKRTSENVNCCIANDCIYEVIGNIHDNPELLEVK